MTVITGINVLNRQDVSSELQKVFTKFGCFIKTRLGLHNTSEDTCYPNGIILLEITDDTKARELIEELKQIKGIEVQQMKF